MSTITSIIFITLSAIITAINVKLIANNIANNYSRWQEQKKLLNAMQQGKQEAREFNKRRMCETYCKYRHIAATQEDLDVHCEICPLNEL